MPSEAQHLETGHSFEDRVVYFIFGGLLAVLTIALGVALVLRALGHLPL